LSFRSPLIVSYGKFAFWSLFYLTLLIGLFCDALLFIIVHPPYYDRALCRFLKQDFLL